MEQKLKTIPPQLQREGARFIRIAAGDGKNAIDAGWPTTGNYRYDDPILLSWIDGGGNVGLVGGFGNLGGLDIDNEDILDMIMKIWPQTYAHLSGGKELPHFVYEFDIEPKSFWINVLDGKYYLNGTVGIRVLDFKGKGGYILIPPSKTIKEYKVISLNEIVKLKYEDFFNDILRVFDIQVEKKVFPIVSGGNKSILEMATRAGLPIKKNGKNFQIKCLYCIEEEKNPSLTLYTDTNTYYCFGCGATGDMLMFEKKLKDIENYRDFKSSIKNGRQLMEMVFPKMRSFVENLIPEAAIINHSGKASTLKTMTALHLLIAAVAGKKALGVFDTVKCIVLFLDTENGWRELHKRIGYICNGLDVKKEDIENSIFFLSDKYFRLDSAEGIEDLRKYINEMKVNIVCVDGLKRFTKFDENNASDVNEFFNTYIRPLIIETKVSFYYIMHLRKGGMNGSIPDDPLDEARGSGELVNIPDIVIFNKQQRGTAGKFILKMLKNRLGTILPPQLIEYSWDKDKLTMICKGDTEESLREADRCAMAIMEWLGQNNKVSFKTGEILDATLEIGYSKSTRENALVILKNSKRVLKIEGKKGLYEINRYMKDGGVSNYG